MGGACASVEVLGTFLRAPTLYYWEAARALRKELKASDPLLIEEFLEPLLFLVPWGRAISSEMGS